MLQKEIFQNGNYTLHFAVDYPEGFSPDRSYPVIFYFHGMGGVQQGVDYIMERCPVNRERVPTGMADGIPPLLIIPSCPDYMWFENFPSVVEFIKSIIARPYVNEDRICLCGSSMGGYTCWMLSVLHPELFAAAAICCGGGLYWAAPRITFPVRAYHGKEDTTVYPRESETMVDWINRGGGNATLILYDGVGHNAWDYAYTDPDTYHWMMGQRRGHST